MSVVSTELAEVVDTGRTLTAYPNPTSDALFVESPSAIEIELYTMLGQRVRTLHAPSGRMRVEVGDLAAGIYLLRAGGQITPVVIKR